MAESGGDTTFQLSLPIYEGPIEALVDLVAQRKVAVDALSIAEVTGSFLRYVNEECRMDLQVTGDFVASSARLMVLKSAFLSVVPDDDEEDTAPVRQHDAVAIGAFRELAAGLRAHEGQEVFAGADRRSCFTRPLAPRSAELLRRAWGDMAGRVLGAAARLEVPAFVRLETALSTILRRLRSGHSVSLRALLHGVNRRDAVVHFLAALELVRRRQALATQDAPFGDISLEWPDGEHERERADRAG